MKNNPFSLFNVGKKTTKNRVRRGANSIAVKINNKNLTTLNLKKSKLNPYKVNQNALFPQIPKVREIYNVASATIDSQNENNLSTNSVDKLNNLSSINLENLPTNKSQILKNEDKTNELEKRIKHLENSGGNTAEINNLTNIVDNLQTEINQSVVNIENLTSTTVEQKTKLDNLQAQTQDLSTLVNANAGDILAMQDTVDNTASMSTKNAEDIQNLLNETTITTNSLNDLNSKVNEQRGKFNNIENQMAINSTNITSLTQDVNSCITAINEINNGAELPTPLFTIPGHSFATPVYSTYDEITLYTGFSPNRRQYPIYFICEAYSPITLEFSCTIKPYNINGYRNFYLEVDGQQVGKQSYDYSTENEFVTLTFKVNLTSELKYHNVNFYIQGEYSFFYEITQKINLKIYGKNPLIINRKIPFQISPSINDNYILTRTVNQQAQIQIASYENLDLENGWTIPNYAPNFIGNNHALIYDYDKDENNNWYIANQWLLYNDSKDNVIYRYDILNDKKTNLSNGGTPAHDFFVICAYGSNLTHIGYSYVNIERISYSYYWGLDQNSNNIINSKHSSTEIYYCADVISANPLFNPYDATYIPASIFVTIQGEVYLKYVHNGLHLQKIGFGAQPYLKYEENTNNLILYLNKYGSIFRYYLVFNQDTIQYNISEIKFICCADLYIECKENQGFKAINGKIEKL